jgi:two-component system chemotaxis response regulator CheY
MNSVMKNGILIVDDALFMRVVLRDILQINGFKVIGEASNKTEAVTQYKRLKPDVVFMDIVLDFDTPFAGIEAVREIFKYDSKAKIVVVSAVEQKGLLEEAFKMGIKKYISKPFEDKRVVEVVREILNIEK